MARTTTFRRELQAMLDENREGAIDDMLSTLRAEGVIKTIETLQMIDALAIGRFGKDVVLPSYRDRAAMLTATRLREDKCFAEQPLRNADDQFDSRFQSAVSLEFRTSVDVIKRNPS